MGTQNKNWWNVLRSFSKAVIYIEIICLLIGGIFLFISYTGTCVRVVSDPIFADGREEHFKCSFVQYVSQFWNATYLRQGLIIPMMIITLVVFLIALALYTISGKKAAITAL